MTTNPTPPRDDAPFPATGPFAAIMQAALALPEDTDGKRKLLQTIAAARRADQPARVGSLTLSALQFAHVARQDEWCPDQKPDLSFRGNELGGECGEAQNVIKKLERERHGWRGSRDTVDHLGEELADVIHCAILVAITAGIDIEKATIAKFNATSEKNGLAALLPTEAGAEPCGCGDKSCTACHDTPPAAPTDNTALVEVLKRCVRIFEHHGLGGGLSDDIRELLAALHREAPQAVTVEEQVRKALDGYHIEDGTKEMFDRAVASVVRALGGLT